MKRASSCMGPMSRAASILRAQGMCGPSGFGAAISASRSMAAMPNSTTSRCRSACLVALEIWTRRRLPATCSLAKAKLQAKQTSRRREIGGALNCAGAKLKNAGGSALSCDGAKVTGNVFLGEGFEAEGEVRFVGAEIGGVRSEAQKRRRQCALLRWRESDRQRFSERGFRGGRRRARREAAKTQAAWRSSAMARK